MQYLSILKYMKLSKILSRHTEIQYLSIKEYMKLNKILSRHTKNEIFINTKIYEIKQNTLSTYKNSIFINRIWNLAKYSLDIQKIQYLSVKKYMKFRKILSTDKKLSNIK